ncbi:hypothetical protein TIFTF001_019572 [Ficus carica]|uniref:F-box protein n=1 Tax=Ficus carica TaxID=3494 RepID=A0AA88ABX9_FICCA|nr:hypothetical protein TIFTF001_019572 [Ficus carica]
MSCIGVEFLEGEAGYEPIGIAGFDLVDEVFKDIIRIPASLKSCEAVLLEEDHRMELRVIKEYGVEESWTKLYHLNLSRLFNNPSCYIHMFEVGFHGELILHENRRLIVLRPSSEEDFDISFYRDDVQFDYAFANYRESLVQIDHWD